MGRMSEVLAKINSQMHEGRCPQSGCIGECAAIDEYSNGVWWAALYIWDHEFNDSARVAKWFHDAGAGEVLIRHVLHDEANGDRDGRTFDGVRAWHVQFSMPQNVLVSRLGGAAVQPPTPMQPADEGRLDQRVKPLQPSDRTMNRCKTCKHWTPYSAKYPTGGAREDERSGGICGSDKLTEDHGQDYGADMLVYPYSEGGEFWTGSDFGCVNHEAA